MNLQDIINEYGTSYQFEKITGMSHASFLNWKKKGYIPFRTQVLLERMTEGRLKASESDIPKQ